MSERPHLKYYMLFVIVDREKQKRVEHVLASQGADYVLTMLARGTARTDILSYLGIADTKRALMLTGVTERTRCNILRALDAALRPNRAGAGILFTVPLRSVGGPITLDILKGGQVPEGACEVRTMGAKNAELIITIVDRGYSMEVVRAAQEAGAKGGTVVKGRATGQGSSAKFYGITVDPQKDLVFLLVPTEIKTDVMRAVCNEVGLTKPGRGISFSMPVVDVIGAYGFEDAKFAPKEDEQE